MEWNWETLLWIGGFLLLLWFMMRACGGMMGRGCGMGGQRHFREKGREPKSADATERQGREGREQHG